MDSISGFEIPAEQVPKDPQVLLAMLDFLNDSESGLNMAQTRAIWREKSYPDIALSVLESLARSVMFDLDKLLQRDPNFVYDVRHKLNGKTYDLERFDAIFNSDPTQTIAMVGDFNETFWVAFPYRFEYASPVEDHPGTLIGVKL